MARQYADPRDGRERYCSAIPVRLARVAQYGCAQAQGVCLSAKRRCVAELSDRKAMDGATVGVGR
jgi:hypothetical protein